MKLSNHPAALPMLFFTEMWERFSYYGMRALLVLYLVNHLHVPRAEALAIYATYTGLVYLTPIFGGYLADRFWGSRKAILIGGLTMALGHFAMAFPALLHLALGLLIIGNGFFKPNIGTLLGSLYSKNDARRDSGFIIFYIGVNLGAFLSPLVAGTLGENIGWHWGFASAGIGMCFGLAQFIWGQRHLGTAGLLSGKSTLDKRDALQITSLSLLMIPLVYGVLYAYAILHPWWQTLPHLAHVFIVLCIFALLWRTNKSISHKQTLSREEWKRIIYILILGVFVVFFWMGFEQAGGTMNLFADQRTNRWVGGWQIPASYFQAINPLAIILLGPLFAALWNKLDQSTFAMPTAIKMGLGMIILGLGFVVLAIANTKADVAQVGPQWLIGVYLLHTIAELCISPMGLSMVTNIAPLRVGALMLGIWYIANALANYLAGILENLLTTYHVPLYWFLVSSSIGAGLLLLLISPLLNHLIKESPP